MRTHFIAVVAAMSGAFAAPAQAFHPFEETYGYVMPKKFKRGAEPSAEPASDAAARSALIGETKALRKAQAQAAKGKSGAKPSVAAVAPAQVAFTSGYEPGSIVIDTAGRKLYYVTSSSSAFQYPVAVGKKGFAWSGTKSISKQVAWPDWRPPAEMRKRKPGLPEHMAGGVNNPLGAKALYLGSSLYRIHGTNDVSSIGTAASSGCIRMTNGNVVHLASLAKVGTKVHVLNKLSPKVAKVGAAG